MSGIHISKCAPNTLDTEGEHIKGTSVGGCRKEVREHRCTCCTDRIEQLVFILLVSLHIGIYEPSQKKAAVHPTP